MTHAKIGTGAMPALASGRPHHQTWTWVTLLAPMCPTRFKRGALTRFSPTRHGVHMPVRVGSSSR